MINFKKWIPERIKVQIKLLFFINENSKYGKHSNKQVYVFLAGFYQNLGDMAITYAQVDFLKGCYPGADIVVVPASDTYLAVKQIKKTINPDDIITIVGGGNMSNDYQSLEDCRLHVVRSFPNNKIVLFPQTIEFNNSHSLHRSRRIYSAHKKLVMFARECASFNRSEEYFTGVDIRLAPDIVLSLAKIEPRCKRNGVLCCLRSDKEQYIESGQREMLIKAVQAVFDDVTIEDTVDVALDECTEEQYKQTLESFWDMLRHKDVVITDRLHCMIFCVITGTPCVAMDNSNHKISGMYQAWLQNVDYIRFVVENDAESVLRVAKEIREIEVRCPIDLLSHFENLRKVCTI